MSIVRKQWNRALSRGDRSYNTFLGEWWYLKSHDGPHLRAYANVARYVRRFFDSKRVRPRRILDYACGSGGVLKALARLFPQTKLVGLDGSEQMLEMARYDLRSQGITADILSLRDAFSERGPQVRLIRVSLPTDAIPPHQADAALFVFPNMNFSASQYARIRKSVFGNRNDREVARFLSRLPDMDNPEKKPDSQEIYEDLLYERALSRNIHRSLKRGRWWFKVDYSNCHRRDLSDLTQWQMLFSESSFDIRIKEPQKKDPFELADNVYHRSRVILDVYEQTQNKTDSRGGYMISTFRAR